MSELDPDKRAYFLITSGKEYDVVRAWQKRAKEATKKRKAFLAKLKPLGATGFAISGDDIHAVTFKPNVIPDEKTWRRFKNRYYVPSGDDVAYAPARSHSKGKKMAQEMAELAAPGSHEFNRDIGAGMYIATMDRGMCILRCGFQEIGKSVILTVPAKKNGDPVFTPKGEHKLLKLSEYHKLVEDNSPKKRKAAAK